MAGPLDGLDLGAPDPTKKKPPAPAADASGPLSGIDLTAPAPAAKPATYDDTTAAGLLGDTAYRAADTGTLGALDYGLAGLHAVERGTGYDPNATDLATIHKQNEEWQQNHPYIALGADVAGYTLGAGKLGIGARIAENLGGRLAARVAGSAAENAITSGISEEANTGGQADVGDLLKHAAISAGVGAVGGAIPGQKGKLADAVSPTKDLGTATETAFRPLEATHYDPSVIAPQFDAIKSGLAAKQTAGISDSLDTQIDKISRSIADKQKAGQSVTADDLTNFQIDLNKAAQGSRAISELPRHTTTGSTRRWRAPSRSTRLWALQPRSRRRSDLPGACGGAEEERQRRYRRLDYRRSEKPQQGSRRGQRRANR